MKYIIRLTASMNMSKIINVQDLNIDQCIQYFKNMDSGHVENRNKYLKAADLVICDFRMTIDNMYELVYPADFISNFSSNFDFIPDRWTNMQHDFLEKLIDFWDIKHKNTWLIKNNLAYCQLEYLKINYKKWINENIIKDIIE
jgi:hypothetical protein